MNARLVAVCTTVAVAGCVDLDENETLGAVSQAVFTETALATWTPESMDGDSPRDVLQVGSYVYWSYHNTVQRIPTDGSPQVEEDVYCTACGHPDNGDLGVKIAVSGTDVYYLAKTSISAWDAVRHPTGAEFPLLLGQVGSGSSEPALESPLLVTDGFLYYLINPSNGAGARLFRLSTNGGSPSLIHEFAIASGQPWGLASDSGSIYAGSGSIILKINKTTLGMVTLTSSAQAVSNFVISGNHLYFTELISKRIRRVDRTLNVSQTPTTLFTDTSGFRIESLAVGASTLFWTIENGLLQPSELRSKPIIGGTMSVLATVPATIHWADDVVFSTTGPSLYWGQGDSLRKGTF